MRKTILASTLLLGLPSALSIGGCQTWGPTWSEISGNRYNVTVLNRRPAVIEQVDGYSAYPSYPIKVEPGEHKLVIQGPAPGWRGPNLAYFALDTQPCKRYFVNAQFKNPIEPGFEPVIDYVEDIAGCKVELAKK
jgi:hypothetical protein